MKCMSMDKGFGTRVIGNSNYYKYIRGIVASKRTVMEIPQGVRLRGVTELGGIVQYTKFQNYSGLKGSRISEIMNKTVKARAGDSVILMMAEENIKNID